MDSIDILTDFDEIINNQDEDEFELELELNSNAKRCSKFAVENRFKKGPGSSDVVSKMFNEIYSKPIDYWLLKPKSESSQN